MIIKGDLDRMAEDIGHAGKSWYAEHALAAKHEQGKLDVEVFKKSFYMQRMVQESAFLMNCWNVFVVYHVALYLFHYSLILTSRRVVPSIYSFFFDRIYLS